LRPPIAVTIPAYSLSQSGPQLDSAVDAFAEYVAHVAPGSNTRSKYGLLGPAGKAITELKAGRNDRDSLIGYTLRAQESARAGQIGAAVSVEALRALEKAMDGILSVLKNAPEPYHAAILDRLDYGLYYRLRRRQMADKEVARLDWIHFLGTKYGSPQALGEAWGRPLVDLETMKLMRKRVAKGERRSKAEQADIDEFYITRKMIPLDEDESQ